MAKPLKDSFGPDVPERIGNMVARVYRDFEQQGFLASALDGYCELELTPRARKITAALAEVLPRDRERAIGILIDSLGPEIDAVEPAGMGPFLYLPYVFFVAEYGLDCFETSMRAQHELTRRFTAEFSIRAFLDRHTAATLALLRLWALDSNPHVRRLVSEGTRPRLPWAPRLRRFQADPAPVIKLLELLKDDPEEYVRRSVANNLNDITRDHPEIVLEIARRWWRGGSPDRRRLVRHALRTLIKQAHPGALAVLGFGAGSPADITGVSCTPRRVRIGGKVRVEVVIHNPSEEKIGVLVDLRVHFVKANGSRSPRVFKGAERTIGPGESTTVRKTLSVAQHSTRKHYPGVHEIEVIINGKSHRGAEFELI